MDWRQRQIRKTKLRYCRHILLLVLLAGLPACCGYAPLVLGPGVVGLGCYRFHDSCSAAGVALATVEGVGLLHFHGTTVIGYADLTELRCDMSVESLAVRAGNAEIYVGRAAERLAAGGAPAVVTKAADLPGDPE